MRSGAGLQPSVWVHIRERSLSQGWAPDQALFYPPRLLPHSHDPFRFGTVITLKDYPGDIQAQPTAKDRWGSQTLSVPGALPGLLSR